MLFHHDDSQTWRTQYEKEELEARDEHASRRGRKPPFKFPKFREYMLTKIEEQDCDDGTTPHDQGM